MKAITLSYIGRPAIKDPCSWNRISLCHNLANHYEVASHTWSAIDFSTKQLTFDKSKTNYFRLHISFIIMIKSKRKNSQCSRNCPLANNKDLQPFHPHGVLSGECWLTRTETRRFPGDPVTHMWFLEIYEFSERRNPLMMRKLETLGYLKCMERGARLT